MAVTSNVEDVIGLIAARRAFVLGISVLAEYVLFNNSHVDLVQ